MKRGIIGALALTFAGIHPAEARQLKVLAIGNSFSLSMMREFPKAAAAFPGCELDIANMMIGGCTLRRHWSNVEKAVDPSFRPYCITKSYAFEREKGDRLPKSANIPEMLTADKWDIVTIQQGSSESAFYEKYQPYADKLIGKIRELAPQAEIRIQQTWSYSPYDARLGKWGMTPQTMYEALKASYDRLAKTHDLKIIPTGDAIQLFRAKLPVAYGKLLSKKELADLQVPGLLDFHGDPVGSASVREGRCRIDPSHLNDEGKYLQACVWLAALFEVDVSKLSYEPARDGFAEKARIMRQCAAEAVAAVSSGSFVPRPAADSVGQ